MNSYRYLAPLVALVGELRHILARKWTNPEWHKQLLPTQPGSLQNGLEPCIPILLEVFQRCSISRLQSVPYYILAGACCGPPLVISSVLRYDKRWPTPAIFSNAW